MYTHICIYVHKHTDTSNDKKRDPLNITKLVSFSPEFKVKV